MKSYKQMTEKNCELCGKICKGRRVCAKCSAKRNGWKQSTVNFKQLPKGYSAQAIFNIGMRAIENLKDKKESENT